MLVTQDKQVNAAGFADLQKALGAVQVKVQASTGTMMERIASGENLIGYNLNAAYALTRAQKDPSIGIVMPKDYTLVLSRVMFIAKRPRTPTPPSCGSISCSRRRARRSSPARPTSTPSAPTWKATPPPAASRSSSATPCAGGHRHRPAHLPRSGQATRFLKQWNSAVKGK
jgi:iron(III) transport system substrate-binding protein